MKLSRFSVKNSMFINLFSVVILIAGFISLTKLNKEAFPPVAFNVVMVTTYFRGASAEKVERLVTVPLERELREVSNINKITSSSTEGISTLGLEVSQDVKDLQKVVNDIQKAVDRVTNLPEGVEDRPTVTEITAGEIPVIKVSVSGNVDEFTLRQYADGLKDQLENINKVASVKRDGWRDEEYWVEPHMDKMTEYYISFTELALALKAQNVDSPGGKQEYDGKEFVIKVKNDIKTKEDIEDTVIRANDLGNWIRVKDVATVKHTFKDETIMVKALGTRCITLIVVKKESGDIIQIVDDVHKIINKFREHLPPEIKIATFYDLSFYVKRRLNVLRKNGLIGFILVITVLFLFLPPIPAFMTALGIPISFFITFCVMSFFGITINLITMFGLVMVLGIIVDDGIIISENVYRHIENGLPPREAAVIGTDEVTRPVLATVLTSIVAFSPLMFMSGLIGKFVMYIPVIVIIALSASLMEAFVILPSHLADFARPVNGRHAKKESRWFKWLLKKYKDSLNWALQKRYILLGGVFILLILVLIIAKLFMPFVLFSSRGVEQFQIRLETQTGTSLNRTNELIRPVEEMVAGMPDQYLDAYEANIGILTEERGFDPATRMGSNFAIINVYLTPSSKRDKDALEIMDMLRPELKNILDKHKDQGIDKLYFREFKEGPPVGKAIEIKVRGEKYETIMKIVRQIKDCLSTIKGVKDPSDNYDLASKEINVIVDEEKAQSAYLTNSKIAYGIRAAFSGIVATTIKREKAEKEIKVLVRVPHEQRNDEEIFNKIVIANKFGKLIPLRKISKLTESQGLRSIKHYNGKRAVTVSAEVDTKQITSLKANNFIMKKFKDIPNKYPGYSLIFGGEHEETMESMHSLIQAFLIAVILIYVILATQFNSLVQPLVVMLTIPFGVIGFIIAFILHNEPLGFLGIMGFIGLTGVVVNDSIVLVDFINKRRDHIPIREAIVEAGTIRLRPVLVTTITTVCGLATVAYGIGGLDPFLKPMALAISWGLMFATALTLILIPCVYLIIEDTKILTKKIKQVISKHPLASLAGRSLP